MVYIVSGIDPQKGGYNSNIWSSHNGTENFMNEVIANGKAITEKSVFYSIHFFGQYYVFSKNRIVRDLHGDDRIGNFSFSIAVEGDTGTSMFNEIDELEKNYANRNQNQENDTKEKVSIQTTDETGNETVYLFYDDLNLLRKYFRFNPNYKKYKRIFFIDQKYYNNEKSPLHSVLCDKIITIDDLISHITSKTENELRGVKKIIEGEWKELLLAFLLGGLFAGSGFYIYHKNYPITITKTSQREIAKSDTIVKKQDFYQLLQDASKIANPTTDSKKDEIENPKAKEETNTPTTDSQPKNEKKKQLSEDVLNFLLTDCKGMTLNQINDKISKIPGWQDIRNLAGFAKFIQLIAKNPPTKTDIKKFMDDHRLNLDPQDEYVKFITFLASKEDAFFNKESKQIYSIYNQTLKTIEQKYGYDQ